MTIKTEVIAHSVWEDSPAILSAAITYPRFVHSEFMTHRVFSRNASSSRAIPIQKMIQQVSMDPAMPVAWGANKPGMQAGDEISTPVRNPFYPGHPADPTPEYLSPADAWLLAQEYAVYFAEAFAAAGYHKQIVNRLLEPFAHITVIVTATHWQNFFDLRCHPDADPTIKALADQMRDTFAASTPVEQQWHLPYFTQKDAEAVWSKNDSDGSQDFNTFAMISAARCARVSYLNHDGTKPDIEKDMKLANMLLTSKHMSPFEHQAQGAQVNPNGGWFYEHLQGNFTGWNQHRKALELRQ